MDFIPTDLNINAQDNLVKSQYIAINDSKNLLDNLKDNNYVVNKEMLLALNDKNDKVEINNELDSKLFNDFKKVPKKDRKAYLESLAKKSRVNFKERCLEYCWNERKKLAGYNEIYNAWNKSVESMKLKNPKEGYNFIGAAISGNMDYCSLNNENYLVNEYNKEDIDKNPFGNSLEQAKVLTKFIINEQLDFIKNDYVIEYIKDKPNIKTTSKAIQINNTLFFMDFLENLDFLKIQGNSQEKPLCNASFKEKAKQDSKLFNDFKKVPKKDRKEYLESLAKKSKVIFKEIERCPEDCWGKEQRIAGYKEIYDAWNKSVKSMNLKNPKDQYTFTNDAMSSNIVYCSQKIENYTKHIKIGNIEKNPFGNSLEQTKELARFIISKNLHYINQDIEIEYLKGENKPHIDSIPKTNPIISTLFFMDFLDNLESLKIQGNSQEKPLCSVR